MQDHDLLMREFINIQKHNSLLQEKQLEEMTKTRLTKQPTNSKFPSQNDKNSTPSQFREWYNKVISILATDEWSQLNNPLTQDIIANGKLYPSLNNHLYSSLLLALKESVETFIQGMTRLRGDGTGILHALRIAYKGTLTAIEIMQLQGKLLGGFHFRGRNESIEQFASRTIQMAKDLSEHGIFVIPQDLKTSFISGLGPDFHDIIKDLQKNKLDPEWQPLEICDLIDPARTYLRIQQHLRTHHTNYKSHTSSDNQQQNSNSSNKSSKLENKQQQNNYEKAKDRQNRIQQAIKNNTSKIEDFQNEVPTGRCVYHGTSHSSKICTKLLDLMKEHSQTPPTQPNNTIPTPPPNTKPVAKVVNTTTSTFNSISTPSTPQQPPTSTITSDNTNINEALTILTDFGDVVNNNNKTNEEYFCITSKSVTLQLDTNPRYTTIVDSGAYPTMFTSKEYFSDIQPWTNTTTPNVILADGSSSAPIQGIGTVKLLLNNRHPIELHNALYVPTLSTNLFSVKEFLHYQGTFIIAEHNIMTLAFPTFTFDIPINQEISFQSIPTNCKPIFSTKTAHLHSHNSPHYISKRKLSILYGTAYRAYKPPSIQPISNQPITLIDTTSQKHTTPTPSSSIPDTPSLPSTSPSSNTEISTEQKIPSPTLKPDTNSISTNSQIIHSISDLATELPYWLHHDSKITLKLDHNQPYQKGILLKNTNDLFIFHVGRSRKNGTDCPITHTKLLQLYNDGHILRGHTHLIRSLQSPSILPNTTLTESPLTQPIIPTEHKPISTWPSHTSFTTDQLKKALGFRNIDHLVPHIQATSLPNFSISTTDKEKNTRPWRCCHNPQI